VERLAHAAALVDAGGDVIGFFVIVGGWRGDWSCGAGSSAGITLGMVMVVVDVDFEVATVRAYQDLVVMVVLRLWTATLDGWRPSAASGVGVSVDVNFGLAAGRVDVDFCVAFAFGFAGADGRGCWDGGWLADLDYTYSLSVSTDLTPGSRITRWAYHDQYPDNA
jgi:hypothetical protein